MNKEDILKNLEEGKPYLDHKNAILSAPVRHMFMIATIWYLVKQNKNKNITIMEIGTWFGASALSWAQGLEEYSESKGFLTCVDAWKPFFDLDEHKDNDYVLEMEELLESDFAYNIFLHNISTLPKSIIAQHLRGQSENILKIIKDSSQSVVFIDADHTYNFVKKESNISFFKSNPRLSILVGSLERMNSDRKTLIFEKANNFINEMTKK